MAKNILVWDEDSEDGSLLKSFLMHEFTSTTLSSLVASVNGGARGYEKKEPLCDKVIHLFESKQLSVNDILLSYAKSSRMWLSLRVGNHSNLPQKNNISSLLRDFNSFGWHGPLKDKDGDAYYVYTKRVRGEIDVGESDSRIIQQRNYRWPVIARITDTYMALSWYGFSYSDDASNSRANQFPFWLYIEGIFDELEAMTGASLKYPDLYNLVLEKLWDKYLNDPIYIDSYEWEHLRIKAESSGVALNAKSSSGPVEMNLKGLKALAKQLSTSALEALGLEDKSPDHDVVEAAMLRTIIKGWGTKAYEFSLDRWIEDKSRRVKVFRAYCNFGLRTELKNEDALLHLKCYSKYGNSNGALDFLLQELDA